MSRDHVTTVISPDKGRGIVENLRIFPPVTLCIERVIKNYVSIVQKHSLPKYSYKVFNKSPFPLTQGRNDFILRKNYPGVSMVRLGVGNGV